jgi:tRNA threonylcarbamoyladenosine biosynthesis protein TsaE
MKEYCFLLTSKQATRNLAFNLAKQLKKPCLLLVTGELGAGKTTFVQGFVKALDNNNQINVQSPTYALAHTYHSQVIIHHLDLYRIYNNELPNELLAELGILELIEDNKAFRLVEWPIANILNFKSTIKINLDKSSKGRSVTIKFDENEFNINSVSLQSAI